MTEEEKWLVNDKYCKECKYYGWINRSGVCRCCDYTYLTGKIRKNPPASCEVRVKGKKHSGYNGTEWLFDKRKVGKKSG